MEKFNRTLRGYDPEEVNAFLDQIIGRVEKMVQDIDTKNEQIKLLKEKNKELEDELREGSDIREKLTHYENMEGTLNQAILMAQKTSDQLKVAAHRESEIILDDAKKNASRIVNEALIRAEKIESESETVRKNVIVLKRRLKTIIESQLEIIDDIDDLDI